MKAALRVTATAAALWLAFSAAAQGPVVGTEEFGMTPKQLVEAIEKVEGLISKCMREKGFEYVAADYNTVRRSMNSDKKMPGMSEKEFFAKYGFGVSTTYTGQPPQLASGYSPSKEGLGERNIQLYKKLSTADQVAYNRALFGENAGATFAVSLEKEDFSPTGGCTRTGVAQVFKPDQLASTYYNPTDALINKDPRMKKVISKYVAEMRKAGFAYNHPDEVEVDIRRRLAALTAGGSIPLEKLSPEQRAGLKELQSYELRVAAKHFKLQDELLDPVADKITEELSSRKPS